MSALTGQALAAALAEAGYVVVPVPPRSKVAYPKFLRLDAAGKPSVAATIANPLTPDEVRNVKTKAGKPWKTWGLYVTGDLMILDVDVPDGMRAFLGHDLPNGPTVRSGSGTGFHYWLRAPAGVVFPKTRYPFEHNGIHVGELKTPKAGAQGSLVMLAGQFHEDTGRPYVWEKGRGWGEVPLPDCPDWLMVLLDIHGTTSNADPKGRAIEREGKADITSDVVITSDIHALALPLSLAPAFQSDEFAQRVIERGGSIWPAIGKAFRCVIPGHEHDETGTRSAAVFRDTRGQLRYRCFRGHQGSEAWSLVHIYAYLKTGDIALIARGGLGKGVIKLWAARALLEFGMTELPGGDFKDELREPEGVRESVLEVWRGFVLGLNAQSVFDLSNVYVMVYATKFAASWCGVPHMTAYRAIQELVQLGFLRKVGKTGKEGDVYRADAFSVGPAAFRWGSGPGRWYAGGKFDPTLPRK